MTDWILQQGDYLLRVLAAGLCGMLIGYERESRMKLAGIRTHTIIAMAASMMVVISKYGFFDVITIDSVSVDASRVAASVVSGIGFLGAGIIWNRKTTISGVTTSAGIWATLGIGMAMGAGMWTLGVGSTVILLVMQYLFHKNWKIFNNAGSVGQIHLHMEKSDDTCARVSDSLGKMNIQVTSQNISISDDGCMEATLHVQSAKSLDQDDMILLMESFPEIISIDF